MKSHLKITAPFTEKGRKERSTMKSTTMFWQITYTSSSSQEACDVDIFSFYRQEN